MFARPGCVAGLPLPAHAQGAPFLMGVIVPKSGPASQYSGPIAAGMQVAQKQINDAAFLPTR